MPNTLQIDKGIDATKKSGTTTPTLLIIDDDESLRKVMAFRLKNSYKIIDSGSPEEALALALQYKPDAFFTELHVAHPHPDRVGRIQRALQKYLRKYWRQGLFSKAGRHRRVTKEADEPNCYQSRWPAEKAPRPLEGDAKASRN